jgi:hypothetical protein
MSDHPSCYCSLWETHPKTLEDQGIPPGYCGLCDVCGAPGHMRHFPGAAPYTGAWCRRHYRRAMWLHPLGRGGAWIWLAGLFSILALLYWSVF